MLLSPRPNELRAVCQIRTYAHARVCVHVSSTGNSVGCGEIWIVIQTRQSVGSGYKCLTFESDSDCIPADINEMRSARCVSGESRAVQSVWAWLGFFLVQLAMHVLGLQS